MKILIRACLLISVLIFLSSCKQEKNEPMAFTLETGLESEIGTCIEDQPSSVLIKESGASQAVSVVWEFPCGAEIHKPYLTVTRKGSATLVFDSEYGKNSCSCARSIDVKINNRLKNGDTLYVVVNKEVVSHKLLATSEKN